VVFDDASEPGRFGPDHKESHMNGMTNTILKLAAAAATAVVLTLGAATPSLAFNSNDGGPFVYEPGGGAAWSHDSASAAYARAPSAYRARAQARGGYRGRAYDNPPGSRFQSRGESRDDMGCPC
jgi:hypothetical protein